MTEYSKTVFINCPFDDEYRGIQQHIIFTVMYLKFDVQIASQIQGSEHNRLSKIQDMIATSEYSIHDLSRLQAKQVGEYYRLNMPLELGMDMGAKTYCEKHNSKKFLILEAEEHTIRKAASDLNGFDLQSHNNIPSKAMKAVRDWLVNMSSLRSDGSDRIEGEYLAFQDAFYQDRRSRGFSEKHAREAASGEVIDDMKLWILNGKLPSN